DDYLRMVEDVYSAFDRPAITTDIIVGFPGESNREFEQTMEIVDRVRFIYIHAFSFSPRPGTAAARWTGDFVRGPVVNERIGILNNRAAANSLEFRRGFVGEEVKVLVERATPSPQPSPRSTGERESGRATDAKSFGGEENLIHHGRSERYFD